MTKEAGCPPEFTELLFPETGTIPGGISDEIVSWLCDLGFDIIDLVVDLKQSTNPLIDPKTIKQNEKNWKKFEGSKQK